MVSVITACAYVYVVTCCTISGVFITCSTFEILSTSSVGVGFSASLAAVTVLTTAEATVEFGGAANATGFRFTFSCFNGEEGGIWATLTFNILSFSLEKFISEFCMCLGCGFFAQSAVGSKLCTSFTTFSCHIGISLTFAFLFIRIKI